MAERITRGFAPFQKGQQVWLEAKNLRFIMDHKKLAMKRQGPFAITDVLGPLTYRLKLPDQWKIHPVFHSSLLLPYRETKAHGVNYTKPPPEIIADIPEWEVEEIKGLRRWRKKWQYYIKWKGYPNSDSSWEPIMNVKNAMDIIRQWHLEHPHKPIPSEVRRTMKL